MPGDSVVLDNLPALKVAVVREAIEEAGGKFAFPSSLFTRPQLKRNGLFQTQGCLQAVACQTVAIPWEMIGEAIQTFSPSGCKNYFEAAGHEPVQ
tara:strand:- start:101 stop:385 length:285 start_codon:yes stop_codon:yes gene_type:complete